MSGEGILPGPRRIRSGLVAGDSAISPEAARTCCCLDGGSISGFGHDGGGFGPYCICNACGAVFGKTSAKDGNG